MFQTPAGTAVAMLMGVLLVGIERTIGCEHNYTAKVAIATIARTGNAKNREYVAATDSGGGVPADQENDRWPTR